MKTKNCCPGVVRRMMTAKTNWRATPHQTIRQGNARRLTERSHATSTMDARPSTEIARADTGVGYSRTSDGVPIVAGAVTVVSGVPTGAGAIPAPSPDGAIVSRVV